MKPYEEALNASEEMLEIVTSGASGPDAVDRISKQTVADFDDHFTPGLLRYRKSVTEAGDYAAIEWEGSGSIVHDLSGRAWIDCLGGYGIYSLGIRHPEVMAAVQAQLERNPMPTQELLDPFKAMLCRLMALITPGDISNAFIANSGTESIEAAMKIARVATHKPGYIVAEQAFHGKTLGALSLMGKPVFREAVEPLLGPVFRTPFGDAHAVERVLREHASEVASVIMEPIQGEAGAVVPPDDYWPTLRELCDSYGVLLVADEVQTGLGRTGRLWAVDHWDVKPDMLAVAKSLGGGVMPVGAICGTAEVWSALEENPFLHTSTFGGSPLACAAAIASIHVSLRDRLWEKAERAGNRFMHGLCALKERYPRVLQDVRGKGLLIGMVFPDHESGYKVAAGLFRRGVLVAGTQISATTIRIEPALDISDELIDEVLNRVEETLSELS
ncbi:MAG: aminotransferase class III-fold pyridoxal phosphate-dependent enzyme [Actinomycetota bacterium]